MHNPHEILKEYFGYDQFRPLQLEIIENVTLHKHDTLVLMPTGGGKSLCYQVPAMMSDGICIVISPLIALMKDQVEALRQNGVNAAFMNSTQLLTEQRYIEQQCLAGSIKLLYVSPEKLQNEAFKVLLWQLNVTLFAIDEAHCISFWGHDFRPEYTQLAMLKERFPNVPIIALTATADELTRQDIQNQLGLRHADTFISSFDRPNLFLEVRPGQDRIKHIVSFLMMRPNESGIIYCLSRKSTEQLAEKLNAKGFKAAAYHAKLSHSERSNIQEAFIKDDIPIICATIAFGMGIDKPNVRFVIHYNLPKNIESYYQEIGRAGRDGLPSRTILFYSFADVIMQREMLNEEESSIKELKLAKLERLQQFAEAKLCRRRILLNYFNEHADRPCGKCDICQSPSQMIDGTLIAQKALSAVVRTNEKEAIGTIIDVLRGYRNTKIIENKYDQLKTYGIGRDLKTNEWSDYIIQLINLGYLHIAYNRNNALTLTPRSRAVLFNGEQVQLVKIIPREKTASPVEIAQPIESTTLSYNKNLFDYLRQLRKGMADEQGVPPYVIFPDTTLREMATFLPKNESQMLNITGVGARKMAFYGNTFLEGIAHFLAQTPDDANNKDNDQSNENKSDNNEIETYQYAKPEKQRDKAARLKQMFKEELITWRQKAADYYKQSPHILMTDNALNDIAEAMPITTIQVAKIWTAPNEKICQSLIAKGIHFLTEDANSLKNKTREITYAYLSQALSPEQIAEKRQLGISTIYGHLIDLYEQRHTEGYNLDLHQYISQHELQQINIALKNTPADAGMKGVLEALGGEPYNYSKIRMAQLLNKDE